MREKFKNDSPGGGHGSWLDCCPSLFDPSIHSGAETIWWALFIMLLIWKWLTSNWIFFHTQNAILNLFELFFFIGCLSSPQVIDLQLRRRLYAGWYGIKYITRASLLRKHKDTSITGFHIEELIEKAYGFAWLFSGRYFILWTLHVASLYENFIFLLTGKREAIDSLSHRNAERVKKLRRV